MYMAGEEGKEKWQRKRRKCFFIMDSEGDLLGVVLATSWKAFEKKCKKAGFKIVERECCGQCDCGDGQCDCHNEKMDLIHIPREMFAPVSDAEKKLLEIPVWMEFMKVDFCGQSVFVDIEGVEKNDGWIFQFIEKDALSF